MKRISSKIMLLIIGCSIFTACLVGGFSLYQGTGFIKSETQDKLTFMVRNYATEFSQTLQKAENYTDSLHSAIIATFDFSTFKSDPKYIEKYEIELDAIMRTFASNNNNALGIYVTFNPDLTDRIHEIWYEDIYGDGKLYKVTDEITKNTPLGNMKEGWVYPEVSLFTPEEEGMDYLYVTMKERKPIWFKPYKELGLNITAISYVEPIIIEDIIIGVVGIDIDFEYIKKTIKEMHVYKNGYAFLMNENFDIMVHPNYTEIINLKDIENEKFFSSIDPITQNPYGIIEYLNEGKKEILGYCKLSNGWILALVPPINEIFLPIESLSVFIIFLTFAGILVSMFIAYLFSSNVSETMDTATKQLKCIELGDFTKEIPEDLLNRNDDLGDFIKSVYTMQNIIKDLTKEFESQDNFTSHIHSLFINDVIQKTQEASSNAAIAIEQIATEQFEKDENLKETLNKLENLNSQLQVIVNEEVQKNRQKDAVMIYQSRLAKMGQMIGNIAHQWRQPLNSLTIILSELKDSYEYGDLNKEHFDMSIQKSRQIIKRMSQTIDDFRDFLSPSKKKEPFSVFQNIQFSLELLEESIRTNNIIVVNNFISDAKVWGYSNEFSQVISNIINNAKDALIEANPLNKIIDISVDTYDEWVEIKIYNNGNCISPEIMDKIFTPYFTTKTLGQGTGIGLYMSKMIIEAHMNGKIHFENVKEGVCCCITLPIFNDKQI